MDSAADVLEFKIIIITGDKTEAVKCLMENITNKESLSEFLKE